MSFECILINTERMEELRFRHHWSLEHEGALGTVFALVGLCEGPVWFPDKAIAAFMNTTPAKWRELRDDLVGHGVLTLSEDGHVYICDEGDLFKYPTQGRRRFPTEVRKAAERREKGACAYCGTTDGPFHLDHVLPITRGGLDEPGNLTLACRSCNTSKGDKTLLEWVAFLRAEPRQ